MEWPAAKGVDDMRVMLILLLCPVVALAQQGPKPAAGLLTERVLSLDMAMDIARAALDKCRADGYRTTVAIVDAAGHVKVSVRDDGTSPHTVEVARKKAYTALIYRRPSMETAKTWATQDPPPSIEGTIALGGGMPIRAGDQVVGSIGVSGAPGQDRDEACANAGIAAVAARLK
jgi:uncharacterized protein GlcG (DUF336 family)